MSGMTVARGAAVSAAVGSAVAAYYARKFIVEGCPLWLVTACIAAASSNLHAAIVVPFLPFLSLSFSHMEAFFTLSV